MLTYEEAKQVLGPVDDSVIADVVKTGATREELVEALAWIGGDDVLIGEGRSPPKGVVAALVDILAPADEDEPSVGGPASTPSGPMFE
ncbi:MAG TPA: hypothetical protein VMP03_16045 [Methylomirabilota bacterium]|nr:hypothetical protein [Methylomirabilota bacterium]